MSAQRLPTPDRLRHLHAMGLQPLVLRGAGQEPAHAPQAAPEHAAQHAVEPSLQVAPQPAASTPRDAEPHPAAAPAAATPASNIPTTARHPTPAAGPRLRIWFSQPQVDVFEGPHRRLLQDLLCSIGLTPDQVQLMDSQTSAPTPGSGAATGPGFDSTTASPEGRVPENSDLPILAFGIGAPAGSTRIAALPRLRDPLEKRIAWPMLRQLRRRLRSAA